MAGARAFCEAARTGGATVGLVPTMGALHAGHLSLLRRAVAETDVTVVSIFVNPLQFGAGEDLEAYPRGFDDDAARCAAGGAAAVFAPSTAEMYPAPPVISLDFGGLSAVLEGALRPGHLGGVGVVVAKLFAIVGACRAYFGGEGLAAAGRGPPAWPPTCRCRSTWWAAPRCERPAGSPCRVATPT